MNYLEPYQKKLENQIANLPKLVSALVQQNQSAKERSKPLEPSTEIDASLQQETAMIPKADTEVFTPNTSEDNNLEVEIINTVLQEVINQTYT